MVSQVYLRNPSSQSKKKMLQVLYKMWHCRRFNVPLVRYAKHCLCAHYSVASGEYWEWSEAPIFYSHCYWRIQTLPQWALSLDALEYIFDKPSISVFNFKNIKGQSTGPVSPSCWVRPPLLVSGIDGKLFVSTMRFSNVFFPWRSETIQPFFF